MNIISVFTTGTRIGGQCYVIVFRACGRWLLACLKHMVGMAEGRREGKLRIRSLMGMTALVYGVAVVGLVHRKITMLV